MVACVCIWFAFIVGLSVLLLLLFIQVGFLVVVPPEPLACCRRLAPCRGY